MISDKIFINKHVTRLGFTDLSNRLSLLLNFIWPTYKYKQYICPLLHSNYLVDYAVDIFSGVLFKRILHIFLKLRLSFMNPRRNIP